METIGGVVDELVALLPVQPFSYLYSGGQALWKDYNLEESTGYTRSYHILTGMVHMVRRHTPAHVVTHLDVPSHLWQLQPPIYKSFTRRRLRMIKPDLIKAYSAGYTMFL